MAADLMFKDYCEDNDIEKMIFWHESWSMNTDIRAGIIDANYLFASAIIYSITFIDSGNPEYYDKMIAFFESGKMTEIYKPVRPELYDWFKSTAENYVALAKQRK